MATIPKAPPSPQVTVRTGSPLSSWDVARWIDLMTNFFHFGMEMHPGDVSELRTISARIRISSNL
jgi:hypothetical protein